MRKRGAHRGRAWGGKTGAQKRGGLTVVDSPCLSILSSPPFGKHEAVPMKDRLPALLCVPRTSTLSIEDSFSPMRMDSST